VRTVCTVGIFTADPASRNRQPASRALERAALTVKPVIRGTWQLACAEAAALLGVPVSANGMMLVTASAALQYRSVRPMTTTYPSMH
jgi:hypothetical protein